MGIVNLFKYYNEIFIPIYAEVVARRQAKPRQVANEIENAFSHLATYHSTTNDSEKSSNLSKAVGHIQRATLDCQKILWMTLMKDAVYLSKGDGLLEHATNVPLDKAIAQFKLIQEMGIQARLIESQNTGISIEKRIEFFQKTIEEHKKFDDMVDIAKVRMFASRQKKSKTKEFVINNAAGFFIGIVAGILGNYAYATLMEQKAQKPSQAIPMTPNIPASDSTRQEPGSHQSTVR